VEQQPWSEISLPTLYETYQEMFKEEDLDLVCVFLPYSRNAYAIRTAAEAGVHVLSEKPVAVNFEDLKMVETAVSQSKIRLSAMFALRYAPTIFTIKQCVASGMIGIPQLATAQKSYKWGESRPWFYKHREIYGSTILWVGIHAVDYIRWCCGLEVLRVSGFHSNLTHSDYPGTQDNVSLAMEMEGGRTASLTMDFLRPGSAPTHGDDRLRIAGSKGVIETRELNTKVEILQEDSVPKYSDLQRPRLSLFAEYVSELRGQGSHLISNTDALQVTKICIAATEAANTGTVVSVQGQ
jgi:predicted dehydrogenase